MAGVFIILALTASVRLAATDWTDHLYFGETMAVFGACLGLALGTSRFSARGARWLGLAYTLFILPWQLSVLSELNVTYRGRLATLGVRFGAAFRSLAANEKLDDPILFIAFITLAFWLIGLIGGYRLVRHADALTAVLPGGLALLVVQIYDPYVPARLWMLAFYLFLSLFLVGRVYYIQNREAWRKHRVLQMPETARDFTNGLVLVAALVVLTTWNLPLSLSSLQAAANFWREFVKPLRPLGDNLALALDPLQSPYGRRGGSDFYGESLALGRGLPLSEDIVFSVEITDPEIEGPPRYYWRGRVFSTYINGTWVNPGAERADYEPAPTDVPIPNLEDHAIAKFRVHNAISQSLLYVPSQPVWVDRAGDLTSIPLPDGTRDIIAFQASPPVQPREVYEVRAAIVNPSVEELRAAGTAYPDWVTSRYLQLPRDFSPRVAALARELTAGQATPYDQAAAVTTWIRAEIEYQPVLPKPPEGVDTLEWFLFEYKRGFCVYDATAEVLMLRSLGIPARMAVGFAQGEYDDLISSYSVARRDYHAWPEVYFPGIGWVEFEPTGIRDPLVRPLTRRPGATPSAFDLTPGVPTVQPNVESEPPERIREPENAYPKTPWYVTYRSLINWLAATLIPILLWLLDKRTGWFGRIPQYLEARALRAGNEPPRWIRIWAGWTRLTPIERAFESINASLRALGHPQPIHVTPGERARRLIGLLPAAQLQVQALTEQHERALYARAETNPSIARRAALVILFSAIRARLIQWGQSVEERIARPNSFS